MRLTRIKEVLEEQGKSAKWLANEIGITEASMSAINNGAWPREKTILAISKALNVDIRDLFHPTKEAKEVRETLFKKDKNGNYVPVVDIIER